MREREKDREYDCPTFIKWIKVAICLKEPNGLM